MSAIKNLTWEKKVVESHTALKICPEEAERVFRSNLRALAFL